MPRQTRNGTMAVLLWVLGPSSFSITLLKYIFRREKKRQQRTPFCFLCFKQTFAIKIQLA